MLLPKPLIGGLQPPIAQRNPTYGLVVRGAVGEVWEEGASVAEVRALAASVASEGGGIWVGEVGGGAWVVWGAEVGEVGGGTS